MTDMPQMVAIYNGMGGGAAALIAAVEFMQPETMPTSFAVLGIIGALIGSVTLQRQHDRLRQAAGASSRSRSCSPARTSSTCWCWPAPSCSRVIVALQHTGNMGGTESLTLIAFFALSLLYGVLMTLPIGGADMPVVISLYNALTGLAVGFEGYVLGNGALIIAGIVVGAAGTLLTQLMAKAMNRSHRQRALRRVRRQGRAGAGGDRGLDEGDRARTTPPSRIAFAQKVIIVPGYGMAVAQAQHKVWELAKLLRRPRHPGEVRHPPGGRPHARAHERAARRGRRALRHDLRPRRDQRRVPDRRRRHRHRRQRRREPGRPRRPRQPHLRHADPGRGQGAARRS